MSEKYWLIRGDEKTPSRIMSSLGLFQGFTAEEEELLVQGSSLAAGDEPRIIDEHFAQSRRAALSQPARLLGFLQLKYDKYVKLEYAELEPTIKWFEWMSGAAIKPSAALYWKAMADYARWIGFGTSRADALELVGTLYP